MVGRGYRRRSILGCSAFIVVALGFAALLGPNP
jgi:hypothetical protein